MYGLGSVVIISTYGTMATASGGGATPSDAFLQMNGQVLLQENGQDLSLIHI